MKTQIVEISLFQTSKVLGLMYFFVSLPLLILTTLPSLILAGPRLPTLLLMVMPFVYCLFGFLLTLFAAWVYNRVAARVGGIEFTTRQ
jgi:hypothetical protein